MELSTKKLLMLIENQPVKIIDIRPVDAYNGWKMHNEKRGGHIKGAKSLPFKWTNYIDWIEVVRAKNIEANEKLVVYGYSPEESAKVKDLFYKAGFEQIYIYNYFVSEWASNEVLPMEQLPRYRNLVSAEWVNQLISGAIPAEYDNNKFKIVHAHYCNRAAYLSGHIPGAIDMDTLALESPDTWNCRGRGELQSALELHGITADTTVVLYGKFMWPDNAGEFPGSAAGQIGAMRNAFIMLYAGVKDIRILNGGFQSWKDAKFAISTKDFVKIPVSDFGSEIPANPELIVNISQAKEMLLSEDAELVCVRSYPEYIGEISGYNYIKKKGRIPGAVFADCGSDAYHMENYRNLDHTTREFHEIEEIWKKSAITPDKHLAFYCGTGWRGSEAWLNAWLMGWPRISVFDDGWFGWSNDPNNPFETGT